MPPSEKAFNRHGKTSSQLQFKRGAGTRHDDWSTGQAIRNPSVNDSLVSQTGRTWVSAQYDLRLFVRNTTWAPVTRRGCATEPQRDQGRAPVRCAKELRGQRTEISAPLVRVS